MRTHTPHATLARLLDPVLSDRQCSTCGDYYDISDPNASYPHNNH